MYRIQLLTALCVGWLCCHTALAEATNVAVPAAILPFAARGGLDEQAVQVTTLLFAELLSSEAVSLVERETLDAAISELKLSRAGVVKADEAVKLGQLTGAKLLITGSVMIVDGDRFLVAKVISSETSRMAGASVKGAPNAALGELVKSLATQINDVVAQKSESLLPKTQTPDVWMAKTRRQLLAIDHCSHSGASFRTANV